MLNLPLLMHCLSPRTSETVRFIWCSETVSGLGLSPGTVVTASDDRLTTPMRTYGRLSRQIKACPLHPSEGTGPEPSSPKEGELQQRAVGILRAHSISRPISFLYLPITPFRILTYLPSVDRTLAHLPSAEGNGVATESEVETPFFKERDCITLLQWSWLDFAILV